MTVRRRAIVAGSIGLTLFVATLMGIDVAQGDTIRHSAWEMAQALGAVAVILAFTWLAMSWVLNGADS